MLSEKEAAIIHQVKSEVARRLMSQQAGHGFDHVLRVWSLAKRIQKHEGGNLFLIELAALLHDVGDAKFNDGQELSGSISRDLLDQLQVPESQIQFVVHIVDNMSFRKRRTAEPLSLEGRIVQDADRLDAIGAIGIVRTIEYGATRHQPFYLPKALASMVDSCQTGIEHFHEKLFQISELLNTSHARSLAKERDLFMRQFINQFLMEAEFE